MDRYKILIIAITILSCIFKFWNFPAWYGFDWDQEKGAMIVKTILVDHKPALLGLEASQGGMFIGSLFYYFVALFYWFGNMNPMYGVLVNIFFTAAATVSLGYVGEKLFNKQTGVLAAIIYGFSSYLTAFDRTLWNPTPIFFLCTWGFYFLYQYLSQKKYYQLALTTACFAFMFNSHLTVVFVMAFLYLALVIFGGKKFLLNPRNYLIVGAVTVLMLTTLIIFDARHDLWNLRHLINYFLGSAQTSAGINENPTLNAFLSYFTFLGHVFISDLPRIVYVVVILVTIVIAIIKIKDKLLAKQIALYTLLSCLPFLFNKSAFLPYYLLFYFPVFLLLVASLFTKVKIWPLFVLIFVVINFPLVSFSQTGLALKYKQQAVEYIVKDANGRPYQVEFITAPGRKTGFNYLFWLYDPAQPLVEGNMGDLKYKMVLPYDLVPKEEITAKFGVIGVIRNY